MLHEVIGRRQPEAGDGLLQLLGSAFKFPVAAFVLFHAFEIGADLVSRFDVPVVRRGQVLAKSKGRYTGCSGWGRAASRLSRAASSTDR